MMLVRDRPATALLAESNGQAKAVVGILLELLFSPATEQLVRESEARLIMSLGLPCLDHRVHLISISS